MKKIIAFSLVMLMGLSLWTAFVTPASAYKGKVTIALTGEPPTMDPHLATNFVGYIMWRWPYDTLLSTETGTGKIVPWLAVKWEKLSPTKVKFWLRKNVKFADGTPFTAKAVEFSVKRLVNPKNKGRQRIYLRAFDRIEILDDHTLIWHLKKPDNGLFIRLTRHVHIMNPKAAKMERGKISRNTYATGPYILKSWTKGQRMVFEANPNWWGNKRYPNRPKTIVQRRIVVPSQRVNALMTGDADLVMGVMPQFVERIKKDKKTSVAVKPAVRIMYIDFLTRQPNPFADRNVRLAVNYAIDAEKIRTTIMGGRADLIGQIFHPWNYAGHNPNKEWFGFDLAKARAALKASGYPNGFKAELIATLGRFPGDQAICEAVAGMVQKAGIDLQCRAMQAPLFVKNLKAYKAGKKKGAVLFLKAMGSPGLPDLPTRAGFSCRGFWSPHCFKDLDAQINKAAATASLKAQQAEFEKVTDMMKEKVTNKFLFKLHDIYGYRNSINFRPRHDEIIYPWEIDVK